MNKNSKIKAAAKAQAAKAEAKAPVVTPEAAKSILAEMVGEATVVEALGSDAKVLKDIAAPTETPKTDAKPPVEAKKVEKPVVVAKEWEYPGLLTGLSYENVAVGQVVWGLKNLIDEPQTIFIGLPREFVVMKMTVLAKKAPKFAGDKHPDFSGVWNLPVEPRVGEDGKAMEPQEVETLLLGDGREETQAYVGEVVDPWLCGNVVFDFTAGKADAEAMAKFLSVRGRAIALAHNLSQLKRDAIITTANIEKLTEFFKNADTGSIWRAKTVYDGLIGETVKDHKPVKFPKGLDRDGMVKELISLRGKVNDDHRVAYNKSAKDLHAAAVVERNAIDEEWKVGEGQHFADAETSVEQLHTKDEEAKRLARVAEKAATAVKSKAVKAVEGAKVPTLDEMRAMVAAADAKKAEAALEKTDLQAEAIVKHTAKQAVKDAVKVITAQK